MRLTLQGFLKCHPNLSLKMQGLLIPRTTQSTVGNLKQTKEKPSNPTALCPNLRVTETQQQNRGSSTHLGEAVLQIAVEHWHRTCGSGAGKA